MSSDDSQSRRHFLRTVSTAAVSVATLSACGAESDPNPIDDTVYDPRISKPNPFVNSEGQPLLVSVTGTHFAEMQAAGLEALGGLARLIAPDDDVLIKPNCNFDERYPGISDTPSVVATVAAARAATGGRVHVGDMGYVASGTVYAMNGFVPAIADAGAELIHFSERRRVRQPDWSEERPDFLVYSDVYDAPVIVNHCVLKRHHVANMTCAIKNNVGAVGSQGMKSTRRFLHNSSRFKEELAEIAALIRPELSIVDARTVLTVDGPTVDSGVPVRIGRVVLCGDMVATDAYCAQLLSEVDDRFNPSAIVATLGRAEALGLGTADLSNVEIVELSI